MSTPESRAHDAYVDARTVHVACGQPLDRCDCVEPEQPILCAHHQQLLGAVDANSTGVDLDSLAATFARGCDHCQEA